MKAKTIIAFLVLVLARVAMAGAPPINLDVDSNWQQLQPLRGLEVQQGANVELRIRPKLEGAWVDLSGVTARFDARVNMTTSASYQASSDLTTNAAHYIRIPMTTVQTGSALTNYIYSIVLLSGGNQYPLGTGSWNVVASGFAGASSIQTSTVAATTIQLDAEIAARIAGDAGLSNLIHSATNAATIDATNKAAQAAAALYYPLNSNPSNYVTQAITNGILTSAKAYTDSATGALSIAAGSFSACAAACRSMSAATGAA